jgi:hypothetical protein
MNRVNAQLKSVMRKRDAHDSDRRVEKQAGQPPLKQMPIEIKSAK